MVAIECKPKLNFCYNISLTNESSAIGSIFISPKVKIIIKISADLVIILNFRAFISDKHFRKTNQI